MEHGRPLPPRELLQPSLDPALPEFRPRHGADFSGTLRLINGASNIGRNGLTRRDHQDARAVSCSIRR